MTSFRASAAVGSASAPSSPVAGEEFATAASELAQGLSYQAMLDYLGGQGLSLDQIQNLDGAVLPQLVMMLSQANSNAEEPLPTTVDTTHEAGPDDEALLAEELAGLSADDLNQSWYLDPSYWKKEVLSKGMLIPAMPFAENYPDKDNHLDLLKARLLVWNVMHGHAVNAHAEGDWAYLLKNENGQPVTGSDLRSEYNQLDPQVKQLLDQSCQVLFPCELKKDGNHTLPPGHIEYGAHMGFAVFLLAKLLRTRQVKSFRALWYLAREFRLCAPTFNPRHDLGLPGKDLFSVSRDIQAEAGTVLPVARTQGYPMLTPLLGQYSDFKDRFKPLRGTALNVVVRTQHGQIQLTRCEDREIKGGKIAVIVHAPPQDICSVVKILDWYFKNLGLNGEEKGSTKVPDKKNLFYMFWWSAHGCLDGAGSAAKSDECLRALYLALYNQPLPAWEPGFVPDLEAMLCDLKAFEIKINAQAFAGGANWEAPLTHLPRVFPEPKRSLQPW